MVYFTKSEPQMFLSQPFVYKHFSSSEDNQQFQLKIELHSQIVSYDIVYTT